MRMKNVKKIKGLLTPAARDVLDQIVNDFRNQVILGALQSSNTLGIYENNKITVSDIIRSYSSKHLNLSPQRDLKSTRNQLITFVGTIYAILGFGILLFSTIIEQFTLIEVISFAIGIAGVLIAIFGSYNNYFRNLFMKKKKDDYPNNVLSNDIAYFLQEWQKLELIIRKTVALRTGESSANKPISVIIKNLRKRKRLSERDVIIFRDILNFRNKLVHGGINVESQLIYKHIDSIKYLRKKIL